MNEKEMIISVPIEDLDISPARGMLLIERVDVGKTAGGIDIPNEAQEGLMPRWKDLAIGKPMLTATGQEIPIGFKVGDDILATQELGATIGLPIPGKKQVVCMFSAVFATVKVRRN